MNYKIFGGFLIALGIIIMATVAYRNSHLRQQPLVFTPSFMLDSLWHSYKDTYWDSQTGRTIDRQRNDVTTSEGQSYTLLRAVWQDDKTTFDKTWQWTQGNLQHQNDHLFSWLYGKNPDGSMGVLTGQGGQNAAADADTDIATALLFAANRWQNQQYLDAAKPIINDIWNKEVVNVKSSPVLTSDNLESSSTGATILVNPSYFAPYSYRMFAVVDPKHNWLGVVDSSYTILQQSMNNPLNAQVSAQLPPDWLAVNRSDGSLLPATQNSLTTNYGYDALRIPWRLALDAQWYNEPRAKTILTNLGFLSTQWQSKNMLASVYTHSGQIFSNTETPAMYGGSLAYFSIIDPSQAKEIYTTKLESLYNPDTPGWKTPLSYYDDNWSWFGMALYNNLLPNLFATKNSSE